MCRKPKKSPNSLKIQNIIGQRITLSPDPRLWTICDVPGDGNCWIYATVLSHRFIYNETMFCSNVEPQEARFRISKYITSISSMGIKKAENICRKLDLKRIFESSVWPELSGILNYGNVLEILSNALSEATPGKFLWAEDIGEELTLVATILDAIILVFHKRTAGSSLSRCIDSRELGKLKISEFHRNIHDIESLSQKIFHHVTPIFRHNYHFQALLPLSLPQEQ